MLIETPEHISGMASEPGNIQYMCCCSCKIIVIKMTMIWGYMYLAVKNVFQGQQKVKKFYFFAAVLHEDINEKDFNLVSVV